MSKLTKKDISELREFFSLGCEYSGTKEELYNITCEVLKEMDTDFLNGDEILLLDGDLCEFATLDEFVEIFWDKAIDKILNVVETQ